jgi:hypothetical protein
MGALRDEDRALTPHEIPGCNDYDSRDQAMLTDAVMRVRTGRFTGIKMECINRAESDRLRQFMRERYPDIPFYTTYFTWGDGR